MIYQDHHTLNFNGHSAMSHFLCLAILRVCIEIASVSASVRCIGELWSSSFRWFLFSWISGWAKMFHRGAGSPPPSHRLRQQKRGKRFQFGVCLTRADDTLFGHYYRCYIHRFFAVTYMPASDREDLSRDRKLFSFKYRQMAILSSTVYTTFWRNKLIKINSSLFIQKFWTSFEWSQWNITEYY